MANKILDDLNLDIVLGGISEKANPRSVFGMNFDDQKRFWDITSQGEYAERRRKMIQVPFVDIEGKEVQIALPKGVLCIVGPSNSGKTRLAKYIADHVNSHVTRFHEPEYPAYLSPQLLIREIRSFMNDTDLDGNDVGFQDVMVIDSLKYFAYNSDSRASAISGGISTTLFTELTNLSLLADSLGKTIVAVMNFIGESKQNRDLILNGIIGSTGGYISTADSKSDAGLESGAVHEDGSIHFRFQARTEQSKRRMISLSTVVNSKSSSKDGNETSAVDNCVINAKCDGRIGVNDSDSFANYIKQFIDKDERKERTTW